MNIEIFTAFTNAFTYQAKFLDEANLQNYEKAVDAYKKAKNHYVKTNNTSVSQYNMKQLENLWNHTQMPASYTRP